MKARERIAVKISMGLGEKQKSHPDPQWKRSPWRGRHTLAEGEYYYYFSFRRTE